MARFAASVNLALIVMTMADPTLRPSTPPTQRPTAPSPRPTSSTPQPTDLIRILEQDVQSAPFDLPSNTCAAFQVSFEGGSDRKFRVEITDSERGLYSGNRSARPASQRRLWTWGQLGHRNARRLGAARRAEFGVDAGAAGECL